MVRLPKEQRIKKGVLFGNISYQKEISYAWSWMGMHSVKLALYLNCFKIGETRQIYSSAVDAEKDFLKEVF